MRKNLKKNKEALSFKERIYSVVKKIPRGAVLSYKEVATRAGFNNAYRAVGSILKKNFNPEIPCHRVIHSDGTLGRYNRGIKEKMRKLKGEGYVALRHASVKIKSVEN